MALIWIPYFANIQNEKWIREKGPRSQCHSNLKNLISWSGLLQSPKAFPKSLSLLMEMVVTDLADLLGEEYDGSMGKIYPDWISDECPMTHAKYAYVPYDRPPNPESSTATNTPVLWDAIIGAHHAKCGALWGNGVPQTCVLFEDGHLSYEENLTCHRDIFEKYAPLMSQEDAEELRKVCEELDNTFDASLDITRTEFPACEENCSYNSGNEKLFALRLNGLPIHQILGKQVMLKEFSLTP